MKSYSKTSEEDALIKTLCQLILYYVGVTNKARQFATETWLENSRPIYTASQTTVKHAF